VAEEQAIPPGQSDDGQAEDPPPSLVLRPDPEASGENTDIARTPAEVIGLSSSFHKEWKSFRDQLSSNHAKATALYDKMITALERMLESDDNKVVENAFKLWQKLQATAYAQDIESWRFKQEVEARVLEHRERMNGATGNGATKDWMSAGIREMGNR